MIAIVLALLCAAGAAERPGGDTTALAARELTRTFIQAPAMLDAGQRARFRDGRAVFVKRWTEPEGLGPLFNGRSCAICHAKAGSGRPAVEGRTPQENSSMIVRLVPPGAFSGVNPYGRQLQERSAGNRPGEGKIVVSYSETQIGLAGGEIVRLRNPHYRFADLAQGELNPALGQSVRVAPKLFGLGLLEAIPEAQIRAGADPEDRDGDGISGRAQEVSAGASGKSQLGRFGWKAESPTLKYQIASAFSLDMGLSTEVFPDPNGDCIDAQCLNAFGGTPPPGPRREVSGLQLNELTGFIRDLAVPPSTPALERGRELFTKLNCSSCHRPSFTTGSVPDRPHLSGQVVWPYTDLLLHDMGAGLADRTEFPLALAGEWRTPPLWGVGLIREVEGEAFFLHDGRARTLTEAILWHGGEAAEARRGFAELPKPDRDALIRFLESL